MCSRGSIAPPRGCNAVAILGKWNGAVGNYNAQSRSRRKWTGRLLAA